MLYPILLKSLPHDIVLDFNKTIARQSSEERGGAGSTGEQAQRTQQQKASIKSLLLFIQTEIESRERTVLHVSVQEDALKNKYKEFRTTATSTSRPLSLTKQPCHQRSTTESLTSSAKPVRQKKDCFFCESTTHCTEQCDSAIPLEEKKKTPSRCTSLLPLYPGASRSKKLHKKGKMWKVQSAPCGNNV